MKETQENLNPKRKIKNLQRNKKTKGITLIALVVTIIILLILSGVTINMLLGEEGIIKIAQESKNTWETTVTKEQEGLKNLMNELNSIMSDNDETGESDKPEKPNEGPNGKPLVDTITEIQTESNIEAEDRYGNPVIVPKGFKVIVDETTKNATTVPEGIVIEDIKGNQFVWIPTGT